MNWDSHNKQQFPFRVSPSIEIGVVQYFIQKDLATNGTVRVNKKGYESKEN